MRYKYTIFLALLVILLLSTFFISGRFFHSARAAGQFAATGVGNLPPLIRVSRLLGSDQPDRILQMSVGLGLRNQGQLDRLLHNLYDPSSPGYHQFLSVEEFAQRFGPTADQQLAGNDFFANANVPTLPAYLASYVTFIGGLDDANQFYHPPITSHSRSSSSDPNAGGSCPSAGQGGGGGGGIFGSQVAYIPSQFSRAYNYDGLHSAGLQGEGQTVGVFELDGYSLSDVQAYTQCFGGGSVPIQNVVLDGFNGQPGAGAVEVELDMELILSMAPKLAKLIVYEAPNTTQGYNDEFARIVSDRTPVISVSWGDCEKNMGQQEAQQENKYFQEAAAQGQSILVAAGDSGSSSCFQLQAGGSGFDTSLNADDPAAQPFVTAVGGTTLTLGSGNSYQSESVWNGGLFGGAGGGGISQFWKQPAWQKGPGVQNSYSNGMRETPDVSLDADPATGYPMYCTVGSSCSGGLGGGTGGWLTVGGTSAAAPMWAAMIALTDEEAAHQGKGPVGFLNPALYKIASGNHYNSDFHDITPPSNPSTPSNNDELGLNGGAYPVTDAYDMATGWGSFNAAKLAADLVAQG